MLRMYACMYWHCEVLWISGSTKWHVKNPDGRHTGNGQFFLRLDHGRHVAQEVGNGMLAIKKVASSIPRAPPSVSVEESLSEVPHPNSSRRAGWLSPHMVDSAGVGVV